MHNYDYEVILASSDIWYCRKCEKSHRALYINRINNEYYCENCVPEDIMTKSIKTNENGDEL